MAGDEPNIAGFAMLPFAGGETVYKWFENGKGPSQSTSQASEGWRNLASSHNDIAELINKAVRDSGAVWEGQAGDAARNTTSPLATWADVTGKSAQDAGKTADSIGQAYSDAKFQMQKPPAVPDKPFLNDWAFWDTDYDDAVEKNQEVSARNVEAYNRYAETINQSTNQMPTFISPNADDAKMQEQKNPPTPPIGPPPIAPPPVGPPPGGHPPGGDPSGINPPGGRPNGNDDTNLSGWKPPGTGDDTTNPSRLDPNDPRNRPGLDPNDPRNRPGETGIPPGGRYDPNDPRNRPGGPNDPRNRPGGPGGPGGGRSGGGGGGGAGGMRPPGAGGIGGAAAAGMGKGPGGMGGAGSGFGGAAGVAGEGRGGAGGFGPAGAGAGGRGAAGAAGMGGGMGAGGARGEGDDDKEHKSASYLQETEDIFGDGTMVAPPVIGG